MTKVISADHGDFAETWFVRIAVVSNETGASAGNVGYGRHAESLRIVCAIERASCSLILLLMSEQSITVTVTEWSKPKSKTVQSNLRKWISKFFHKFLLPNSRVDKYTCYTFLNKLIGKNSMEQWNEIVSIVWLKIHDGLFFCQNWVQWSSRFRGTQNSEH